MRSLLFRPSPGRTRGPGAFAAVLLVLAAALGLAALGPFWGCLRAKPVRIGFSGPLTGRWADLGVQGRNGATLAVEDLNARGGVAGRQVELVVADEKDSAQAARDAVDALDARGVAVVVGLMTSTAAEAGLPRAEAAGLAVVSPSATSSRLTGLEDAFFRVTPDLTGFARLQARGVARRQPGCRVLAVGEPGNQAFTGPYALAFASRLAELGGSLADSVDLVPEQPLDGRDLDDRVRAANAAAVLALLPARDLTRLVLRLRAANPGLPIHAVMWGFDAEFLEMAGDSAEGVASCLLYPFSSTLRGMAEFQTRYLARFGYAPASGALLAYEAVSAAALGLERTGGGRQGLARVLAGLEHIPGICGELALDRSGDVVRPIFWVVVRGGAIHAEEEPGG